MGHNHAHHHHLPMPGSERFREMRQVTIIGALVNILLAIVKITLGFFGRSGALIADGVHSIADLSTDAVVLVATWLGSKEADADHPYGHGRFETVGTVILGGLLLIVAGGIVWDASLRLLNPESLLIPTQLALFGAVISILANEGLYQYTMRVANRTNSDLLRANAWHHRSDAISSIVVLLGVGGVLLGVPWLDAVAAVGVAVMIGWIGVSQISRALTELVDTGLAPERITAIEKVIMATDGVASLHLLKSRRMGAHALAEVHIILADPRMSVSEGHQVGEQVRMRLLNSIDELVDVTVHVDPEDDETEAPNAGLPSREQLMAKLDVCWASVPAASERQQMNLHYLGGQVHIEVVLPLSLCVSNADGNRIARSLNAALADEPGIGDVTVLFR